MRILFIGDIFASPGRRIVADHLSDIVATNRIDLTIANGENAAGGFGITPSIAESLNDKLPQDFAWLSMECAACDHEGQPQDFRCAQSDQSLDRTSDGLEL